MSAQGPLVLGLGLKGLGPGLDKRSPKTINKTLRYKFLGLSLLTMSGFYYNPMLEKMF